jgi:hypothetical protein
MYALDCAAIPSSTRKPPQSVGLLGRRRTDSSSARHARDEQDLQSARMYYTAQYERAGRHETNRLTFSNYVIAASFLALGLLAGSEGKQGVLKIPGGIPRAAMTIAVAL